MHGTGRLPQESRLVLQEIVNRVANRTDREGLVLGECILADFEIEFGVKPQPKKWFVYNFDIGDHCLNMEGYDSKDQAECDLQILLAENPQPTQEEAVEALNEHICRCCGYVNILDALQSALRKPEEVNPR